jgi:hypothetical protein
MAPASNLGETEEAGAQEGGSKEAGIMERLGRQQR